MVWLIVLQLGMYEIYVVLLRPPNHWSSELNPPSLSALWVWSPNTLTSQITSERMYRFSSLD